MDKKEFGKKVWEKTKFAASCGVGVGTGIVTTTICMAFMPQGAGKAIEMAFRAGTYGLSAVTGTCAQQLAEQEIEANEERVKAYIRKHSNQNKVTVKIVK